MLHPLNVGKSKKKREEGKLQNHREPAVLGPPKMQKDKQSIFVIANHKHLIVWRLLLNNGLFGWFLFSPEYLFMMANSQTDLTLIQVAETLSSSLSFIACVFVSRKLWKEKSQNLSNKMLAVLIFIDLVLCILIN